MIILLGDIHGDHRILARIIRQAQKADAAAIIQVGDFGLFPGNEQAFREVCQEAPCPVYFIDGNHDDCTRWMQHREVTKVWEDAPLFYIPRGTVMEIDNRTFAFMGGAGSIDKDMRLKDGWHWDINENIHPDEVLNLLNNLEGKPPIDYLITHCPPNSVIEEHFDPKGKLFFGVGLDWHDHNQDVIERIWTWTGKANIISGHMHRRVIGPSYRILDINEALGV